MSHYDLPNVASFSGLSIFYCPISVLYHLFVLLLNKTTYHDSIFCSSSTELVLISMNVKLSSFCLSKCFEQPRNVLVF